MEPGGRQPAPEGLHPVQSFLNTLDLTDGRDEFATRESARRWLARQRLLASGEPLTGPDRERLVQLREALRSLVSGNAGGVLDASATRTLDRALAAMRLRVRLVRSEGYLLVAEGSGVDRVVGDLLVSVVGAMARGDWRRFKTCRNDACRWAFYDSSRNRSGAWCSMAVCGNRAKGRAYRERQRAPAAPELPAAREPRPVPPPVPRMRPLGGARRPAATARATR